MKQPRETDFNDDLMLDTGATFSSVKNKDLLAGVHEVDRPIKMCANTGKRFMTERGETLGMKTDPWLDEKSMVNIVSFAELKQQHRVTHDSDHADSVFCHADTGIAEFDKTKEGLCAILLSSAHEQAVAEKDKAEETKGESPIDTVGENMGHHSAAKTK